jgi:hypothetical protein
MKTPIFSNEELEIVELPPRETMGKKGGSLISVDFSKSFNHLLQGALKNIL